MRDPRPMWEKICRQLWEEICRDLGVNPRLVRVYFVYAKEANWDFGLSPVWRGFTWDTEDGATPEVLVVFPYAVGENGLHLDTLELKNTCYHELIHVLLRDGIVEEEVREEIGVPEGSGYYEELTQFLDGCPPEYWRDWISDKATQLEEAHIKENKSLVSDFLSQHLNKGNKNDDNNRNV